jgi:asparagine synthase (glutamine-hydrolysing)
MCGIGGILSLSESGRVGQQALRLMAGELVHRGPDDEGYYLDPYGRCGFAFRRLAIIDPQGGQQPLANEDNTIWVVFNGEIYNFRELRAELERQGHQFRTRCDTEVIVHLYERDGLDLFNQLAGMFAIAVWDERRGRLVLARDRLGKKPLVWALSGGQFYFASELKAIAALAEVPRRVNPLALHFYLLFQYVPAPHSIYEGFGKVPPGCFVELQAGRPETPQPQAYWKLPKPPPFAGTRQEARRQLGALLQKAVARRLVSDVPLGAFLSGGIDSSIIVGLMRRLGVHPLRTFSIGFSDPRYDETAYARLVAQHFSTEHHEFTVTPRCGEVLDTLTYHYDEPFGDSSAIPTLYLARQTRSAVTVALSGDAGDECFGGYERYRALEIAAALDLLPSRLRRGLALIGALLPHGAPKTTGRRLYRFFEAVAQAPWRRYLSWVGIFSPQWLAQSYQPDFLARVDFAGPLNWFEHLYREGPGTPAERAMWVDFNSYLPGDLLTKVDIASMACGLECRCPLLDHELVEFALSLPGNWRAGPSGGKRLLKEWGASLLPATILRRGKMGFGVPIGEWFRGELRGLLEEYLLGSQGRCLQILRRPALEALIAGHLSGRDNHEHRLWALLMLELWFRRWKPQGW